MQIPVESYYLPNGLHVVLSEDHTAPLVAVNLWYHVGSANERKGRTGFAHLFEHMLFQGSANVEANEHFEFIQRAGGTLNGSTWLDRTNYYETLPSNQLELALWLEADRMARLLPAMTQPKLDTQRDVVKNERRWSVDNQPYGTWWEKLPALCFPPDHPFHHSLIGSMEDLDAASLEDIAEFFRTWYSPDNAVLTIAGDFSVSEAKAMVDKHFGEVPRGKPRPELADMTVPFSFGGPVKEVVFDSCALPRLFLASRIPVLGTEENYAAAVCSAILGLRTGSRFEQSLVRKKRIASSASCFTFDLSKGADLFVCDVTALPDVTAKQLEDSVHEELDSLIENGVQEAEVNRAIALTETHFITSLQSASERADQLSKFATYFGRADIVNEQPQKFREINAAKVTEFARNYLKRDNRAALLYLPLEHSNQEEGAE